MNSWSWSWCRKISMRRCRPERRPVVVRSMTWLRFSAARVASLGELTGSMARSSRVNPTRPLYGDGLAARLERRDDALKPLVFLFGATLVAYAHAGAPAG